MRSTQPEDTKWGSSDLTAFDRLLAPCRAEPPSRAAWQGAQERGNGKIEQWPGPKCGWTVPKRAKAPVKTSYRGRIPGLRCWILDCFF